MTGYTAPDADRPIRDGLELISDRELGVGASILSLRTAIEAYTAANQGSPISVFFHPRGHWPRRARPLRNYAFSHDRNMPDEDLASVIVYLRSLPPVRNALSPD